MLIKRIISGVILSGILLMCLYLLPFPAFAVLVTVFIAIGLFEFFTMVQNKGIFIYKYAGITIGTVIPIAIFFRFQLPEWLELALMVIVCFCLFLLQFTRQDSSQAIVGISTALFGIIYVSWFLSYSFKIYYLPNGGKGALLFLALITKGTDFGAFLFGSTIGRHNLIARISPKKTIEGALGGLALGVLFAYLARALLPGIPLREILVLGCFLGIVGQVGDLSESLIKRDCQVKDSGSLIPGLGGVLDVVDSLLFTAPIFYFYLNLRS
jgi:phosphatidate cytidylyltransferase